MGLGHGRFAAGRWEDGRFGVDFGARFHLRRPDSTGAASGFDFLLRVRSTATATVAQLSQFDEIVDVRSPGEFAEDHVPSAVNLPVLDDSERAHVGTLYAQASAFEANLMPSTVVGCALYLCRGR